MRPLLKAYNGSAQRLSATLAILAPTMEGGVRVTMPKVRDIQSWEPQSHEFLRSPSYRREQLSLGRPKQLISP